MNVSDIDDIDVRVLRLQPGDVVVLRVKGLLTADAVLAIKQQWESRFPAIPVAVLSDDIEVGVLRSER